MTTPTALSDIPTPRHSCGGTTTAARLYHPGTPAASLDATCNECGQTFHVGTIRPLVEVLREHVEAMLKARA